jgi:hypothetical protein
MNNEEIHHLMDLLNQRTTAILMNLAEYRLMSESQKLEAVVFDRDLGQKLNEMLVKDKR